MAALQARLFGRPAEPLKIARYVLVERIASGGGGSVFVAHDPELDRKVALKLLHAGRTPDRDAARARLIREAQSLARLSHPNIVEVYDFGTYEPSRVGGSRRGATEDVGVFVVMEYLPGQNLARWLGERSRSWREIRDVFMAAGRGLAAAHAEGIVHRDFKPANVLVLGDDGGSGGRSRVPAGERVKVLDFGLARATRTMPSTAESAARLEGFATPLDLSLTASGTMLGTPTYMAPEQHEGRRADARSDQYAFCLALYEGWFGCSPFGFGTVAELRRAKRTGRFLDPPRDVRIPGRLLAAVRRGLDPDPDARHPSMEALLQALAEDPGRTRRRIALAAGTAGLGLAASLGIWAALTVDRPGCEREREALAAAWNDERAAALERAFVSTGEPWAHDTAERVRERLDAWARAWTAEADRSCGGSLDAARGSADVACRRAQLARVRALVEALEHPDSAGIARAVDATAILPRPERCADALPEPEAVDEDARLAVEHELGRATALEAMGRIDEGLDEVSEARRDAGAPGMPPSLVLEAAFRHGSLLAAAGDRAGAEHELTATLAGARAQRDDERTVATITRLLEALGAREGREQDTERWTRLARASIVRAGIDPAARARLAVALSVVARQRGRVDEVVPRLEEAAGLLEGIEPMPPARVEVLADLGREPGGPRRHRGSGAQAGGCRHGGRFRLRSRPPGHGTDPGPAGGRRRVSPDQESPSVGSGGRSRFARSDAAHRSKPLMVVRCRCAGTSCRCRACRRASRARYSRLLTVPAGISRISAIWATGSCSQ